MAKNDCVYVFGWAIRETEACKRKRMDQKADRQDGRREDREDRQGQRQESHEDNVEQRTEEHTERVDTRKDASVEKTRLRGKFGMSPLGPIGDALTGLGGAAAGIGCTLVGIGCPPEAAPQGGGSDLTTPLLAVGGVAIVGGLLYVALR